jgi:hypothetical protein
MCLVALFSVVRLMLAGQPGRQKACHWFTIVILDDGGRAAMIANYRLDE